MQGYGNVDIRIVGAPVALGSSIDSNSSRIDMSGYQGVIFVAPIEDSVATGVAHLKIETNTADSDSGMTDAGVDATVTCAVNDDVNGKALVAECHKPKSRYVQAVRTSAVANIAYGSIVAILYRKGKRPVVNHSTVAAFVSAVGAGA